MPKIYVNDRILDGKKSISFEKKACQKCVDGVDI